MTLQWTQENQQYSASFSDASEESMASVIDQTMEKAIQLLPSSVKDESRYLLLVWHPSNNILKVVVTNDSKSEDSAEQVHLRFSGNIDDEEAFMADLKFYSKDYLTTCGEFLNYSLIAAFCVDTRDKAQLL
ncbi:MAG: hypothetical protein MI867_30360 [Pseudomonadales bacterium]|nr:hypothetical protein [Pseudomonadales bacterium]